MILSVIACASAQAPADAQSVSAFAGRTILQYNDQGDRSFGGWRLGFLVGPSEELTFQASAGRWANLSETPGRPRSDGTDYMATVRYRSLGSQAFSVALEAGLGRFKGPAPIFGSSERPSGKLVIVGLSVLAVPVWPIGVEVGGYFRDDAGSFDLEARLGVRGLLHRGKTIGVAEPRVAFGTTRYYRLGGVTSGEGLGVGIELERKYGNVGGLIAVDIVPVKTAATNQAGGYDTSLLLFSGGPRFRPGSKGSVTPFVTVGPMVAAYLEGPLSGLRIGGWVEPGLEFEKQLGKVALVVGPSARALVFDGTDPSLESAIAWRFSVGIRF